MATRQVRGHWKRHFAFYYTTNIGLSKWGDQICSVEKSPGRYPFFLFKLILNLFENICIYMVPKQENWSCIHVHTFPYIFFPYWRLHLAGSASRPQPEVYNIDPPFLLCHIPFWSYFMHGEVNIERTSYFSLIKSEVNK